MIKNWNIQSKYDSSKNIVDLLLENRGLTDDSQQTNFLNPPSITHYLENLPSDFNQSLQNAKKIIFDAIAQNLPIIIHGDYDSDGVCATAIVYNTLKNELNYPNVFAFIPNRFTHGYGLSFKSIEACLQQMGNPKKALFITVDNGITAAKETAHLKELGHLVVITDHHQKAEVVPEPDCLVWYDKVVGAGIAWLLAETLGSKNSHNLAFASIATITDLQPVLDFNRAIVKNGLSLLNTNPPQGIKALLQVAAKTRDELTTYDLGWVIGPRLNASGRIEDATASLDLLLAQDEATALNLAQALNNVNTQRQDKTLEMYEIASVAGVVPKIIISESPDYHEGIIGLVAARLMQKYYRPTIVISIEGEHAKGSVRSIKGFDVISFLRNFSHLFVSLGGHPMAAGFNIETKNIATLKQTLLAEIGAHLHDNLLTPTLDIDIEMPLNVISLELLDEINQLKPFGLGNEEPLFVTRQVNVAQISTVGKEKQHLSLKLFDNGNFYKAIYFNNGELAQKIKAGDKIDLAYMLKKNEFNGNVTIDLFVKDLRF